jgi:hypothetical protein
VLSKYQFGFQRGKSTTHALNNLVNLILTAIDTQYLAMGLSCDLSKAFDCVDHSILSNKLTNCGVRGIANSWMLSYLKDRKQMVELAAKGGETPRSSWTSSNIGVPQGSILGPLLFLVYINDLPDYMATTEVIMFADDTTAFIKELNRIDLKLKGEATLKRLCHWFAANKLTLNVDKTNVIQFKSKKMELDVSLETDQGHKIVTATHAKFLGIIIDEHLKWNEHEKYLCGILRTSCSALFKLRHIITKAKLKEVFHAYFQSKATYGITVWGNSKTLLNRVFLFQKRALRTINRMKKTNSCRNVFIKENIMTIPSVFILESIVFIFQQKHLLSTQSDIHDLETRNKHKLYLPKHRLNSFKCNVFYNGIQLFNQLPAFLTSDIKDVTSFKNKVKSVLLKRALYSVEEFYDIPPNEWKTLKL